MVLFEMLILLYIDNLIARTKFTVHIKLQGTIFKFSTIHSETFEFAEICIYQALVDFFLFIDYS